MNAARSRMLSSWEFARRVTSHFGFQPWSLALSHYLYENKRSALHINALQFLCTLLFLTFFIDIWLQPCHLARWSVVWTFVALVKVAMLGQSRVPDWFVTSGAHLWPWIFFCNEPPSHCCRTLCTSAGISATAVDEFLFFRRWKVLQKAAATKSPHRFTNRCQPLRFFAITCICCG